MKCARLASCHGMPPMHVAGCHKEIIQMLVIAYAIAWFKTDDREWQQLL
ncbi:MAG: hypothetical protein ACYDBZ_12700 [Steroidobacteraceae bacterium]